jgi:hypothetical protein
MNLNENNEYTPSLKLLPFGGFDVASLLHKLESGQIKNDLSDNSIDFQPISNPVSSGWLRSKMMSG